MGIAQLLHLPARQCTSMHRMRDGWVLGLRDAWFYVFMSPCCLVLVRWTFFISEQDKVHRRNKVATDRTSWDEPVCTHDTLWRQHYITTSKEYLTNGHILLQFFELVFFQLHLVKVSCKLITIWLSYKINKKGAFLWNTVHADAVMKRTYNLYEFAFVSFVEQHFLWWGGS